MTNAFALLTALPGAPAAKNAAASAAVGRTPANGLFGGLLDGLLASPAPAFPAMLPAAQASAAPVAAFSSAAGSRSGIVAPAQNAPGGQLAAMPAPPLVGIAAASGPEAAPPLAPFTPATPISTQGRAILPQSAEDIARALRAPAPLAHLALSAPPPGPGEDPLAALLAGTPRQQNASAPIVPSLPDEAAAPAREALSEAALRLAAPRASSVETSPRPAETPGLASVIPAPGRPAASPSADPQAPSPFQTLASSPLAADAAAARDLPAAAPPSPALRLAPQGGEKALGQTLPGTASDAPSSPLAASRFDSSLEREVGFGSRRFDEPITPAAARGEAPAGTPRFDALVLATPSDAQAAAGTYAKTAAHTAPHSPPHLPEQVAVRVASAIKNGLDHIEIHLKPASLGRIDVELQLHHDGRVQATVIAERQETLDLFQRDARELARALQDAGLKADANSLNFGLRGGNREGGEQRAFPHAAAVAAGAESDTEPLALLAAWRPGLSPHGIDIRA